MVIYSFSLINKDLKCSENIMLIRSIRFYSVLIVSLTSSGRRSISYHPFRCLKGLGGGAFTDLPCVATWSVVP